MAYFTDKFEGKKYFKNINFHHLEFYVGNAKQACEYYKHIFGFSDYAYAGPETGLKDRVSYVIRKNKVFYVFFPLSPIVKFTIVDISYFPQKCTFFDFLQNTAP